MKKNLKSRKEKVSRKALLPRPLRQENKITPRAQQLNFRYILNLVCINKQDFFENDQNFGSFLKHGGLKKTLFPLNKLQFLSFRRT